MKDKIRQNKRQSEIALKTKYAQVFRPLSTFYKYIHNSRQNEMLAVVYKYLPCLVF